MSIDVGSLSGSLVGPSEWGAAVGERLIGIKARLDIRPTTFIHHVHVLRTHGTVLGSPSSTFEHNSVLSLVLDSSESHPDSRAALTGDKTFHLFSGPACGRHAVDFQDLVTD
jgi:hypothetical protein